jgi:hypothetical protein
MECLSIIKMTKRCFWEKGREKRDGAGFHIQSDSGRVTATYEAHFSRHFEQKVSYTLCTTDRSQSEDNSGIHTMMRSTVLKTGKQVIGPTKPKCEASWRVCSSCRAEVANISWAAAIILLEITWRTTIQNFYIGNFYKVKVR